jgi:hypothetical protein
MVMLMGLFGSPVAAQESDYGTIVTVTIDTDEISWQPRADGATFNLTISGPGDFFLQKVYLPGERPIFKSTDSAGAPLPDGVYTYEYRALQQNMQSEVDDAQRGLVSGVEPAVQSGSFAVLRGSFVTQDAVEGGKELDTNVPVPLDHLIYDDLIVDGSACIGFDCVNGESFGFDTLRLKENNLRLHFDDTSTTASFPRNDWTIVANDSANGGLSYLAFEDRTAGRHVFKVEAGAPNNALYVEDTGDIGIGTSSPVLELDIVDGDTPSVRLNQDGSYGWSPQVWDVAGNESNFFIRDVTNGSKLSFRIQPGAPTNSIYIGETGHIGIGTSAPTSPIHIQRSGTNPRLVLERTDDHGTKWVFKGTAGGLRFEADGATPSQAVLDTSGNLTIQGTLTESSDADAKENFSLVNARELLNTLVELPISSWNFKFDGPELRHLGPMAQDFYRAFGLGMDDKHIAPLDSSGVALAAIQGLHAIVEEKDVQIRALQAQTADLEARLAALEQSMRPAQVSILTALPWLLTGAVLLVAAALTGKRLYDAMV